MSHSSGNTFGTEDTNVDTTLSIKEEWNHHSCIIMTVSRQCFKGYSTTSSSAIGMHMKNGAKISTSDKRQQLI